MRRKHTFGKIDFCLPDFEFVNRCAYFDYHRDKVSVRSSKRSISTKLRSARRRSPRARVNKHVEIRCKRCPDCHNRRLSEVRALSNRRLDLKFFGGGVKKWVTVFSLWRYRCDKCEKTIIPPDYPQATIRYGNGLANWVVYQNVALGQIVLKIKQCLKEVFKLDIPQPTVYRFKAAVANRYKATNISILDGLLLGPSLSVDETEVRLRKETAHVWVFAGVSGAYYEYRESRSGQFLAERLRGLRAYS